MVETRAWGKQAWSVFESLYSHCFVQILWRETKRKYATFILSRLCYRRQISPSLPCISLSSLRILCNVLDKTVKSQKEDCLVSSWIRIGYNLFQDSKAHPTISDIIASTNHCSAASPMRTVHQGLPASYYIVNSCVRILVSGLHQISCYPFSSSHGHFGSVLFCVILLFFQFQHYLKLKCENLK